MSGKPKSNVLSYMGFAAWLVYGLLGTQEYWRTAARAGLVIMLAIVAYEILARRIKIIDCTSLGFFLLVIVELATIGEGYFIRYQAIFGWGLFAVVAWVAMIVGVRFRLQYAREKVPRVLWKKPSFQRMHFRVSVAWAVISTLDTILAAIALGVGHQSLLVVIVPAASMSPAARSSPPTAGSAPAVRDRPLALEAEIRTPDLRLMFATVKFLASA